MKFGLYIYIYIYISEYAYNSDSLKLSGKSDEVAAELEKLMSAERAEHKAEIIVLHNEADQLAIQLSEMELELLEAHAQVAHSEVELSETKALYVISKHF